MKITGALVALARCPGIHTTDQETGRTFADILMELSRRTETCQGLDRIARKANDAQETTVHELRDMLREVLEAGNSTDGLVYLAAVEKANKLLADTECCV